MYKLNFFYMHNFFHFEFNSWSRISANTISDMARRRKTIEKINLAKFILACYCLE